MDLIARFQQIGLSEQKAKETASNKKLSANLEIILDSLDVQVDPKVGALLYQLASKSKGNHLPFIARQIVSHKLSSDQVNAAIKYCDSVTEIDSKEFETTCGIGIVITIEQIQEAIKQVFESKKQELEKKRYQMIGVLLGQVKNTLKWANPLVVKEELEKQLVLVLGPKDERDDPKLMKKREKQNSQPVSDKIEDIAKSERFIFEGELSKLHKPGENPQLRPELMKEHLKRTGGKVVTRFPPEPNGFLHIGHAKAININFGYAKAFNGITYLRYDDTNPEAEEGIYFDMILDTVKWLGYEPFKITYSSDHFQRLYELAVQLIKKDKAYVCFCTPEEMQAHRGGEERGPRTECCHRNRPIQESLDEFQKMKDGKYEEGVCTLRMKMDMQNPNPQFWDLVAYRVLYTPHHRTGKDWCIYPTYDYTHCLCDSFEDITHSMCTTEFQLSRESYYWLVDALDLYKPVQWEYGRLNLTNTVMSKRKLNKLVTDGHVAGWDDPRLPTIAGFRRRGFTPQAINAFVREMGVTTANTTINVDRLEHYVRMHLNQIAPRAFMLLEPLKVTIVNVEDSFALDCVIPAKFANGKERTLVLRKEFFIDASDFREEEDPNFYRLCPGKTVGLLHTPYPITCTKVHKVNGVVTGIEVKYEHGSTAKPKTYIQWLSDGIEVEARLYGKLFMHENPQAKDQVPAGWLSDFNPESLVITKGMVERFVKDEKVGYTFQAVRVGYFCIDKDSGDTVVLNRTVTLKEDSKKV